MKPDNPIIRLYIAASTRFTVGHGHLGAYGLIIGTPDKYYEHWGKLLSGGDSALPKIRALLRALQQLTDTENKALGKLAVVIYGVDLKVRLEAKATVLRKASKKKRLKLIADEDPEVQTALLWGMVLDRPIRNAVGKDEKLLFTRAKTIAQLKRLELVAFYEQGNVIAHGEILEDGGLIEFPN